MYQPYINQVVQSLQTFSSNELRDLLGDDEKLDERVNEAVKSLESSKELQLVENRRLAEENLRQEPRLIELRSRVQELSVEGRKLATSVNEKMNELKSKSGNTNPETMLALLQTAAAECEEESEVLEKQCLNNELAIDAFLDQFMAVRKLMHCRRAKADKMIELLRNQSNANRSTVSGATFVNQHGTPFPPARQSGGSKFYLPPAPTTGSPPAVPYPVGMPSMPPLPMFRPPHF
ncbi:vacuolar protein sorting-associated protein 37B [Anopheles cruzii]|uniref:vacuolar protein sorting-associated protein 37B n=1 Tax=Anopheles cruzii TaxID=68878 RepID=UPI0022EC8A7B|nr:vacuolar protein sorting-associated protein 37B [Anopheles cruzii]